MNEYSYFETERLFLYPTMEEDTEFIFELMNSPKWKEFIGERNIHTLDDAKNYIETRMMPQLIRLGFSNYTVIRKEDAAKIGTCGFYDREELEGFDIGFAFLEAYEGKGYAYEAANALIAAAFNEFDMEEIHAYTDTHNFACQKLLTRLGLEEIGLTSFPSSEEELLKFTLKKSTDA